MPQARLPNGEELGHYKIVDSVAKFCYTNKNPTDRINPCIP